MKMYIQFSTLICVISLNAFADSAKIKSDVDTYTKEGKALMGMINSGKIDEVQAEKMVMTMVSSAQNVAKEYASQHKESDKMIQFVLGNNDKLKTASFSELEKQWHDGAAFKNIMDIQNEENEHYSDPLHAIVHPYMTLKAIKEKNIKAAKEELAEGLEQIISANKQLK